MEGLIRRLVVTLLGLALLAPALAAAAEERADRSTPRRAVTAFLEAAEAHDYARAAEVLDLRLVPPAQRAERGPELAENLHHVLERTLWIEPAQLSDEPAGRPEDGADTERIGAVRLGGTEVPITLSHHGGATPHWTISTSTVARIPRLYEEHGPGWVESRVPASLRFKVAGLALWQWIGLSAIGFASWIVGRFTAFVATRAIGRVATRTKSRWDDELIEALRLPARLFFGVLAFRILLDSLALGAAPSHILSRLVSMATIGVVAYVVGRIVGVLSRLLEARAREAAKEAADAELRARGVATQVRVLRRVINVAIGIIAVALMLTQFEAVRNVGVSLLASAGLAGVVLGFAAQRTFGSLIAGIQLSATQPIRIGDVVIVEGEWGNIEEITLTYVVVKIWDERRLIVPMTRFLEHPFQNWTMTSSELQGTVFFYTDWTLPIDELRKELDRIVEGHPLWDGRTKNIQITDTKERTLEVRALVSAADAGKLWDLRVHVREQVIRWLQQYEGGRYLPKVRVEGEQISERPGGSGAAASGA